LFIVAGGWGGAGAGAGAGVGVDESIHNANVPSEQRVI
jgi:hypothetical protein